MDPEQALKILDQAVAQLTLARQDHMVLLQAVDVLQKAISVMPKAGPV